jgi:crossover junction endodeoxyribonuclease RuvC
MENNIILGVDVGIATTGWSIVRKDSTTNFKGDLIDCGAIITKSEDLISLRLKQLYDGLIEVILLAGESKGLPIFNYTPLQVKTSVTGYGRADKKQIQKMVKLIYGLKAEPKPDDVADAIAVATCHLSTVRF